MNSTVELRDLETGEIEVYTLVYPDQADVTENRISLQAPVGARIGGPPQGMDAARSTHQSVASQRMSVPSLLPVMTLLPVGRETDRGDFLGMALEREDFLCRFRRPTPWPYGRGYR